MGEAHPQHKRYSNTVVNVCVGCVEAVGNTCGLSWGSGGFSTIH